MYIPKSFAVEDDQTLAEFIANNSFATLTNMSDGALCATHLPLIHDPTQGEAGALLGHMARANSHWRSFDGTAEALAIFYGPHAYISPTWYAVAPAVPTWNYAVVHVYGVPRIVEDEEWLAALVDHLVAVYESGQPRPWSGELPADFKAGLLRAIVGFTLDITRVEGKFKLGQNRSPEDQQNLVRRLGEQADPAARALGAFTAAQLDSPA